MSVQFGRWNFEGQQPPLDYVTQVGAILVRYGPDSDESYSEDGIRILYRAFYTTKESHGETQPHISSSGLVTTWDGRLDNRAELIGELQHVNIRSSDVEIVAAAFEEWNTKCFAKLIGDWALSIYKPADRLLILAKDSIGVRNLYYTFDSKQISWCTVLDPLVVLADRPLGICEEYIAGCLSMFPAAHLTPYGGIHAVPPSSFVLLQRGKHTISKYWDFDPDQRIRYRADGEYEEHFRSTFTKALQRRLRSDRPVLAELSGGRDSSCIVCMADNILGRDAAETPRLDTISYYDDSEPNWNERPYFTKVEQMRGRTGCHIDAGLAEKTKSELILRFNSPSFSATPGSDGRPLPQFAVWLREQGSRVVLSGIGGDEVMGGVPTPTPELQDLLASGKFAELTRKLKIWALQKRVPWHYVLFEAVRGFFPPALMGVKKQGRPAPWLQHNFLERYSAALTGYPSRTKLFGPLPSFQDNVRTLNGLRRQLARTALTFDPPYEKRYPYLDRSLLEFLFALPREQLVRPNQRRSLMRRALAGIVPGEILNKKRKAFVARGPRITISRNWANLMELTQNMVSKSLGVVDAQAVSDALQKGRQGQEVPIVNLMRTIYVEVWLRNLCTLGIVSTDIRLKS